MDGKTQIAHVGVNRVSVPLSQIPPDMQHALLAAEDRTFYTEPPISITAGEQGVRDHDGVHEAGGDAQTGVRAGRVRADRPGQVGR